MNRKHTRVKKVKAWAFMQDTPRGKDFLTDFAGETEIYIKKPRNRENPFGYLDKRYSWKPTSITITLPNTTKK